MLTNTYNWQVQWMQTSTAPVNGFNEVVLTVGWICTGSDNATPTPHTASIYSTQTLVPPQAGDPAFVPYNQLTQATVLGWLWAGGVNQTATQEALDTMIANLANPPVQQPPLPWANQGA